MLAALLKTLLDTILTLNLLTTTIVAPPSNASKWQMGFNLVFKGLILPWPDHSHWHWCLLKEVGRRIEVMSVNILAVANQLHCLSPNVGVCYRGADKAVA
jgi:hypothetical protein